MTKCELGGDVVCRSLCLQRLDDKDFLFIGMGDGTLSYFNVDLGKGTRGERSVLSLGCAFSLFLLAPSADLFVQLCPAYPSAFHLQQAKLHLHLL